MSSTYTTEIEGDEGFTYIGDAIITNTKKIQIISNQLSLQKQSRLDTERHQALLNLTNTLETFLKEKPSDIEKLPLKDQPHKLLELLLKQEDDQLALLKTDSNFITTFSNEIKGKSRDKLSTPEKEYIIKIREKYKTLPNEIINTANKLSKIHKEQTQQLELFNFLEKTKLDKLDIIIKSYIEILSNITKNIASMPSVKLGGKRQNTQHTVKKDKKLAKLYKKVKTMKYKKL